MGHHVLPHQLDRQPPEGKRLRLRRSQASAVETSTSTMVKDRRVAVEGQDLPCVRSDAADSATTSQAREEDRSHSSSGNTCKSPESARTPAAEENRGRPGSGEKPRDDKDNQQSSCQSGNRSSHRRHSRSPKRP